MKVLLALLVVLTGSAAFAKTAAMGSLYTVCDSMEDLNSSLNNTAIIAQDASGPVAIHQPFKVINITNAQRSESSNKSDICALIQKL